jgi:tripartite-type tricarboxylate transporter receptor subunit TctC
MSTARLIAICLLAALCGLGSPAAAQSWPGSRPIEVIIPFPAGGGVDAVGRAVVEALGEALRARVVAVNRDGPAGSIGFAALAAAPPDGHVLGFGPTTPITGARHMMRGVRYDVASFDYICQVFENVMSIAVAPGSRFRTAEELFAAARTAREPLTYGHAGVGSVPYLAIEHLAAGFGLRVAQVTFRGDGPMLPALLRGDLDFGAPAVSSIRGREFRPLAVFSDRRHPAFPEVPTVRELGVTGEMVPPGLQRPLRPARPARFGARPAARGLPHDRRFARRAAHDGDHRPGPRLSRRPGIRLHDRGGQRVQGAADPPAWTLRRVARVRASGIRRRSAPSPAFLRSRGAAG